MFLLINILVKCSHCKHYLALTDRISYVKWLIIIIIIYSLLCKELSVIIQPTNIAAAAAGVGWSRVGFSSPVSKLRLLRSNCSCQYICNDISLHFDLQEVDLISTSTLLRKLFSVEIGKSYSVTLNLAESSLLLFLSV